MTQQTNFQKKNVSSSLFDSSSFLPIISSSSLIFSITVRRQSSFRRPLCSHGDLDVVLEPGQEVEGGDPQEDPQVLQQEDEEAAPKTGGLRGGGVLFLLVQALVPVAASNRFLLPESLENSQRLKKYTL